jgi:dihydroorotate dehydrogenase
VYKKLAKPLLFLLDAEVAHHLIFSCIRVFMLIPGLSWVLRKTYQVNHPDLARNVFGIDFPNPVGLAAGFDKDAKLFNELSYFGFGFIEIGTLTPKGQEGNPKPRLFRLPEDHALINRMGFNNGGVEAAIERLRRGKGKVVIGGNIGKNKITPNEKAISDYEICFQALYPYVDYFVVNVSSPNTPNLRALQDKAPLTALLSRVQQLNQETVAPKPVLLKIAPDLNETQLNDIVEIVKTTKIAGVIATNTTINRNGLRTSEVEVERAGNGGLSGAPLAKRATEVIRYLVQRFEGGVPVIGVGGIQTADDAWEKLEAGAVLVQVYSGFIYEGPAMIKRINKGLIKKYTRKP